MADAIIENSPKKLVVDPLTKKDVETICKEEIAKAGGGSEPAGGLKLYKHIVEFENTLRIYIISLESETYTADTLGRDLCKTDSKALKINYIKYTGGWSNNFIQDIVQANNPAPSYFVFYFYSPFPKDDYNVLSKSTINLSSSNTFTDTVTEL